MADASEALRWITEGQQTHLSKADLDSGESTGGTRTPLSSWGSECELDVSQCLEQTPAFTVRNTFIEVVEDLEKPRQRQRRTRSCPPAPSAIDDGCEMEDRCPGVAVEPTTNRAAGHGVAVEPATGRARNSRPVVLLEPATNWGPNSNRTPDADADGQPLMVLELASAIERDLPSVGSAFHAAGTCKPCAFVHRKGCSTGKACQFCHLCDPSSSRRRKKAWRDFSRACTTAARDSGASWVRWEPATGGWAAVRAAPTTVFVPPR
mmetsp:Transcript_20194/g.47275  ORF Transcript_20194/g.47275 Transcript_20194/m.47275 type:complete len:264 (-) Transcript_20194:202-993(-)